MYPMNVLLAFNAAAREASPHPAPSHKANKVPSLNCIALYLRSLKDKKIYFYLSAMGSPIRVFDLVSIGYKETDWQANHR